MSEGVRKQRYIFKSTIILILFTLLSKLLGFFRQILVGYKFGPGSITDAFLITNLIPTLLFVDLSIAIQSNYIPIMASLKGDKEGKNKFTSNLLNLSLIVMLLGIAVTNIIPQAFISLFASGLNEQARDYAIVMLRITSFSIIPIIFSQVIASYLQFMARFFSTSFSPLLVNMIVIIFIFLSSSKSFYILSLGMVVANIVAMIILLCEAIYNGYEHSYKINIKDENIKKMILLTIPLLAENLASNLNIIVDRNAASLLDTGILTSLTYANSIINIVFTVAVTPLLTVIFPHIARMSSQSDSQNIAREYNKYSEILILILVPILVYIGYYSKNISTFLFLRGKFTVESVRVIYESITFYAITILGMGMKYFLVKFFYAMQDTKTPTKISIITLILNIILNLLLLRVLEHRGIAIATSISYTIAYIMLLIIFSKKYKFKVIGSSIKTILFAGIATLASVSISNIIVQLIRLNNDIIIILVSGFVFVLAYFIILYKLKFDLIKDMILVFKRK